MPKESLRASRCSFLVAFGLLSVVEAILGILRSHPVEGWFYTRAGLGP
jgi:hypothetical protein